MRLVQVCVSRPRGVSASTARKSEAAVGKGESLPCLRWRPSQGGGHHQPPYATVADVMADRGQGPVRAARRIATVVAALALAGIGLLVASAVALMAALTVTLILGWPPSSATIARWRGRATRSELRRASALVAAPQTSPRRPSGRIAICFSVPTVRRHPRVSPDVFPLRHASETLR